MNNVVRRAQPWLGTLVEIGIPMDQHDTAAVQHAMTAAFDVVAQVHRAMSRFEPNSDVSIFHRTPCALHLLVNEHTRVVLALAQQLCAMTNGLFDIAQGTGRWVLHADGCWEKLDPGVQVDLGGIAKGYAVDAAMLCLADHGIHAAWVNAGGDLKAMGMSVPVDLRDESNGGVTRWAEIEDAAVATSFFGAGARSALFGTHQAHHVSVIAPSCAVADALTKVVAQTGLVGAAPYLSAFEAQAWVHA